LRDFRHVAVGDPAAIALHQPQGRQQRGLSGGIPREDLVQLGAGAARENGLVFLGLDAHRSISPITISTDALIAIRSESRCPSAIFEMAARLMKEGGRMRQRTGLADRKSVV